MVLPAAPALDIAFHEMDLLTFALENHSSYDQTKPIYIDAENPTRSLNALQTKRLVRKLVSGFKATGLQPGDCVLVVLPNNFLYSALYFGIIGAGGVYLGVNPTSQCFELSHILRLAEPKVIITSHDVLPNVQQTPEASTFPRENIFVLDVGSFPISTILETSGMLPLVLNGNWAGTSSEYTDFVALTGYGESDWVRIQDESTAKSTPATMFSTSGTSGLPKIAMSSHYAMISQHLSMEPHPPYQVSRLISLPFFHCFAALFAHVPAIRSGQPLYILPRFQMEQWANAIAQFKITDTVAAPPIIHVLNRSSLPMQKLFDSIRWMGVGGAPIAAEAMRKFRTYLHSSATLSQVWGMTEIGWGTLVPYPEQQCDGSIGRPLRGYEMRLVDGFGNIVVSDDEPGELQVLYPGMMMGYKGHPTLEKGHWYATGDIMTRSCGKYYVVSRSKELIKVNGWQVAPAELEGVLLTHGCISDVGVIGVLRDDGDTEVPRAYVVRKTDSEGRCSTTSAEEIYDFARSKLASYKALNGGIFFVDYIPRTASGKIQRFKLAQMDQYRRSITELLAGNNARASEQDPSKIRELKARAEEGRHGHRRSSRRSSSSSAPQSPVSPTTSYRSFASNGARRRSKTSLLEKMKALEASRMSITGHVTVLSPTT